ncbi:MAG: hypothetical protein FD147_959 [Chloroflexi bacterium]|nr:MAG: hypothetical protein FD147_959 [Chloroflexota bacterium]MBA4376040.1 hypothetical protein [Anaerolinea sp.]
MFHPVEYFRSTRIKFDHGLVLVLALIAATFLQKLLFSLENTSIKLIEDNILAAVTNSVLTWFVLTLFFLAIVSSFRVKVNIWQLAGAVGAASLPLVIANFLSCLALLFYYWGAPQTSTASWTLSFNILGWIGMAFGWPGYYSYLVLSEHGRVPKKWALTISAGTFILLLLGYWLPAL